MKRPTERQLTILRSIVDLQAKNGYPPALRDIGDANGIRTPQGVVVQLDSLQIKGMLYRNSTMRSIVVTPAGRAALCLPPDLAAELREIKAAISCYKTLHLMASLMEQGPERREAVGEAARARVALFGMVGNGEVQG
jgi:SOS-response transcriptional repressor LexA